jgi:hypothetical protein
LIRAYDETGTLCMILQEFIEFDQFVRCICVGQTNIMPIKYDPKNRRYIVEHDHLSPELGDRIVRDAQAHQQCDGLRHEQHRVCRRDGVPYAIDFMNPAPDMDINSVTPHYFEWAVKRWPTLPSRWRTTRARSAPNNGGRAWRGAKLGCHRNQRPVQAES